MNSLLRWLNTLLLLAILATLLLIWRRMPPTMADLKGLKGTARQEILLRRPYIRSDCEISDTISVSVGTPLEVTVMNDSLSVDINQ
jgi:hypothetical protein